MNHACIQPPRRIDALRERLLDNVRLLKMRCAKDIPDGFIDDYVALSWLEWHGGALRLTTVGENVARQIAQGVGAKHRAADRGRKGAAVAGLAA